MYSRNRWLILLGLIFMLGVFLKVHLLVALSTALVVILGVANWWKKHSLDGVVYRRRFHFTRAFPGEAVNLRLEVENRKFLPPHLAEA